MSDELRERLAEYAHEAWSGWMEYLFSKGKFDVVEVEPGLGEQVWTMPAWAIERWTRQMRTPYAKLSEGEKESDRKEADRMLAIVGQLPAAIPPDVAATMRDALIWRKDTASLADNELAALAALDAALAWLDAQEGTK